MQKELDEVNNMIKKERYINVKQREKDKAKREEAKNEEEQAKIEEVKKRSGQENGHAFSPLRFVSCLLLFQP